MTTSVFSAMCEAMAHLRYAIQITGLEADGVEVTIKTKGRSSSWRLNDAIIRDQLTMPPQPGYTGTKPGGKLMGFKLTLEEEE
jgi:hypothetical protein